MGLRVERYRQTVGIIGTSVVDDALLDSKNLTFLGQRHFHFLDLLPLLRCGVEVLFAVFDPFHRTFELHGQPGQDHLFGVEHHDLGPESAPHKGGHDPNLVGSQT